MINKMKLANVLKKKQGNLKVWKRILMNLYLYGGYEPLKLTTITDLCYMHRNLTPKQRTNLYSTIRKTIEKLRISGLVKRYNNPVRYQLAYKKNVMGELAMIAKELGFEDAEPRDFSTV